MKRLNIAIIVCVIFISIAIAFLLNKKRSSDMSGDNTTKNTEQNYTANTPTTKPYVTQNSTSFTQAPGADTTEEKKSLENMVTTLSQFATSERTLDELLDYLKSTKQDPVMIEDKNDYTGSMFVVRTNSPLPGTRYFHAQYFQDETGKKFVQHMSFEFKPGPQAMQDAVNTIQQNFKNIGKPTQEKSDFAMWDIGNGYVLWVKKQSAEDLENNIMNPSTDADIGTIRIAVEQNPHDDIHEH